MKSCVKKVLCACCLGRSPRQNEPHIDNFKTGRSKVLVATDVAGRGIHVEGISHVVNKLPEDPRTRTPNRRTGRAGASGVSISFASEDDAFLLPDIEVLLATLWLVWRLPRVLPGSEFFAPTASPR